MNDSTPYLEDPSEYPHESPRMQARRYLKVLRQKWWILILTGVLALAGGAAYLSQRHPSFVSTARLWVTGQMRIPEAAQYTEDAATFYGTQAVLLQSAILQERTLHRLKNSDPGFRPPTAEGGRITLPDIQVSQIPKSSVLRLSCVSQDPNFARMYLDALMEEFLTYKKEVRAATAGDALASISEQISRQERELKAEQDKLNQFQSENNVALLEEQVKTGGTQLAHLNSQLVLLRLELKLLDAAALEQTTGTGLRTNVFLVAPDPQRLTASASPTAALSVDFFPARRQLELLKIQHEQLSRYLRPKHPKIVRLNEEISHGEKLIAFARSQTEEQLASAKEALKLRIAGLHDAIKELEAKVVDGNRRFAELERITANTQRQQGFYDRLLTLLQGVDLNRNLTQDSLTILERASPVRSADHPVPLVLAIALLGGMAAGAGILFLLGWVDDRCDSLDELRIAFPENVFGQIPEVSSHKSNGQLALLKLDDRRHVFVESCRNLRSSLLFMPTEAQRPKAILITSAVPEEGKSTVAANLALALALGGARTLLIDGDLRRGSLHRMFGVVGEPGLANIVTWPGDPPWERRESNSIVSGPANGETRSDDPAQFILPTSVPNLSLLPRGTVTQASGDAFLRPAFDALLEYARRQFDYVILDSMPVFAADDTTTAAPKVDAVLFVVRRGHTGSRLAREALDLLYQRQVKVLGLIFNRANSSAGSYRYYKYGKYYSPASDK